MPKMYHCPTCGHERGYPLHRTIECYLICQANKIHRRIERKQDKAAHRETCTEMCRTYFIKDPDPLLSVLVAEEMRINRRLVRGY